MKKKLNISLKKHNEFIVINNNNEVWIGLSGGEPIFSSEWDEAKPLENEGQFRTLMKICPNYKLEKMFI